MEEQRIQTQGNIGGKASSIIEKVLYYVHWKLTVHWLTVAYTKLVSFSFCSSFCLTFCLPFYISFCPLLCLSFCRLLCLSFCQPYLYYMQCFYPYFYFDFSILVTYVYI